MGWYALRYRLAATGSRSLWAVFAPTSPSPARRQYPTIISIVLLAADSGDQHQSQANTAVN